MWRLARVKERAPGGEEQEGGRVSPDCGSLGDSSACH